MRGEAGPNRSRIEPEPVTGRPHPLRVHLLAIVHRIVGDTRYGPPEAAAAAGRLLLHATRIGLAHPLGGEAMQCASTPAF